MSNDDRSPIPPAPARWLPRIAVLLLALPLALVAGAQVAGAPPPDCARLGVLAWVHWFDPIFMAYNLALAGIAVLTVPGITLFYVSQMKEEKLRRLRNDLNKERWEANEAAIRQRVADQFRLTNYAGSLVTLTLVILLGATIILLLKPVPTNLDGALGCGVDYSKGANFLLLGPYMELFGSKSQDYYHHVVISLTAFQFGFLGAYVYLIGDVVRSYFTLDLSPRTFVASTIRIVTGSLLALVLSFVTTHPASALDTLLPPIAFFLGYFPATALLYLKKTVTARLGIAMDGFKSTPLSALPGMSYAHEARLLREGYDNVQNLANARPLDLVMTTAFSYRQMRQWIAQAWLCTHLGDEHYEDFRTWTGITGADELGLFIESAVARNESPAEQLSNATGKRYPDKIGIVCMLVQPWRKQLDRAAVV